MAPAGTVRLVGRERDVSPPTMRIGVCFRGWITAGWLPVLFVGVWSSGFLVGSIGTRSVSPASLGFWRFALAAAALGAVVVLTRAPWPKQLSTWIHLVMIGVLLQTVQFAGAFIAMSRGVSAGLTSLITDSTPLVVAVAAAPLFGERLRRTQVLGLVTGFAGVGVAVGTDLSGLGSGAGILAAVVGLVGSAGGTLYQKRFGARVDLRTGMFIQLVAATASIAPLAAFTGDFAIPLTVSAIGSVVWLALVGSIGAFVLLFVLLRRHPGASATSYLFLVPPSTALVGVPLLGQPLTTAAVAGFALASIGVALVTLCRPPRRHGGPGS